MNEQLPRRLLPQVTVRQLLHFVTAAEAGTLAEAARRLHMAPSAVSSSITELETTLGVQLAVRHRARGLILTPSGESALSTARNLLSDVTAFEGMFGDADDASAAPLHVGCYTSIAPMVLPASQAVFATQHPNATVEFIEESHDALQERLLAGTIDMAFMYDLDLDHRLRRHPLVTANPTVVLPASHRLASDESQSISLHALANDTFVMFSGAPLYEHVLRLFTEAGISPRIAHTTRSVGTMRAFVGRGVGVGVGYEHYKLMQSVENLPIVTRSITGPAAKLIDLCVVLPRGAKPSPLARRWIEAARSVFRRGPAS